MEPRVERVKVVNRPGGSIGMMTVIHHEISWQSSTVEIHVGGPESFVGEKVFFRQGRVETAAP